ncbi:hypothetical protein THRCLA_21581 [Thraustotheca clavata]|uniref:Uncharacterized protein n=1 Tax=Thraustotheca clavata TaxID=74557 RepID=A0A1V9ZV30_9STRA|nr:hypothetical protein THRCLA_21581 [Thraustotheca clavata]
MYNVVMKCQFLIGIKCNIVYLDEGLTTEGFRANFVYLYSAVLILTELHKCLTQMIIPVYIANVTLWSLRKMGIIPIVLLGFRPFYNPIEFVSTMV